MNAINNDGQMLKETPNRDFSTTIYASRTLYDLWRSATTAELAEQWFHQYPGLFDEEDDLRLARSQRTKHFYEWFTTVHLFQREGARSLMEKYDQPSHLRKYKEFERFTTEEQRSQLIELCEERVDGKGVQVPDLFVTAHNESYSWLVEIKGGPDALRPRQVISHDHIRSRLGIKVHVIEVRLI